ncbi:MAG TPA: sugar kinase [Marivita sp.]|nr:sugar kinase [Marivita sp.]
MTVRIEFGRQDHPDMRVLAIGECMAELAPKDSADTYALGFAGDTFNTAWYLAHVSSGIDVSYFTAVGDDAISAQMRAAFRDGGIDDRDVRTITGQTVGLYLITLDGGERSFSYWRGQSAARQLADDPDALARAMAASDLIYFSGITLAILAPSARNILLEALAKARADGKTIAFDTNLRPRLWDSTEDMTATIMQGAAVSDIALPSFDDEEKWFGDADPAATIQRYTRAGATTVVVKNGPDPVSYVHRESTGTVDVPPLTNVIDTTAAGDSFNAAVLAGFLEGTSMPECISKACRLAGQVVQGKGGLVPIDLEALQA